MKVYLANFEFNNINNKNNQKISGYNKLSKKKKKYIASNYNWKEFHSDEEDNSYYNLALNNNYINQNKIKKNRRLSQNSISTNAEKSLKSNIIYNNMKNQLNNINTINNNNKLNDLQNKKVHFLDNNFVKYIDVESYKKYNINEESFLENENSNKANAKCTCFIY